MSIKEKFEAAKSKVKETCIKAKKAVCEFVSNNAEGIGHLAGILIVGGAAALIYSQCNKENEPKVQYCVPDNEPIDYSWNTNYQENWDKVNSFADTLEHMKEGEMYIIEQYNGAPNVSHLVDGTGVYPPED